MAQGILTGRLYICTALLQTCLFLLIPSAAPGQQRTFMPLLSRTEGMFELTSIYNENRNTFDGKGFDVSNMYLAEKIGLSLEGYVYHPRFISFMGSMRGGLRQEKFISDSEDGQWDTAGIGEYSLWAVLLPQHPYNIQFYASHSEPFVPGVYSPGSAANVDSRRVLFSYKQNPLFLSSSLAETRVETRASRTDTTAFDADGSYTIGPFWNSVAYSNTEAVSSLYTHTDQDRLTYKNSLDLKRLRLDTDITRMVFSQTSSLGFDMDMTRFSWSEQVSAKFPGQVDLHASYDYNHETDTASADTGIAEEAWNRSSNTSVNLSHRLYQSLLTSIALRSFEMQSGTGSLDSVSKGLGLTYTKKIPRGMLSSGLSYAVTETENAGTPSVLDELHPAVYNLGFPDPTFTLNQRNVIEDSVRIEVRNPDTGGILPLDSSMYRTRIVGDSIQVTITGLPQGMIPKDNQSYDFYVSYNTSPTQLESSSFQYNIRLSLFDNMLTPYYSYSNSAQTVKEGSVPGGPGRSTTNIAGVMMNRHPYTVALEYQDFSSRFSPYRTLRTGLEYMDAVSADMTIKGRLAHEWTDYLPSEAGYGYHPYSQRSTCLDISLSKAVAGKGLNITLTGSTRWINSVTDTEAYNLTGSAVWRIGLLTVSINSTLSYRESVTATGTQTHSSQYYNITVTRKLF